MPGAAAWQLQIDVAAQDERHIARISALHLAGPSVRQDLTLSLSGQANDGRAGPVLRLNVLPVHELARQVPELSVLQLPFFYPDIEAIHRALDGPLGEALKTAARERGWEILDFWDEGMHVMSGNLPYNHARALQGKEFVLLRDDPIAEIELRALDVWSRRARPASLAQLHTECVVASRSATLQQILSEQLARVHLDLTLTRHRYEGWVVAMELEHWHTLDDEARAGLVGRLASMRAWQRRKAAQLEEAAQRELVRQAMTAHPVTQATWQAYRAMQPAWERFLPESLSAESRAALLTLAAGAAGVDSAQGARDALPQAQHRAP
jgi:TRAP-type C4-dicarboxylate transport system substrate-binding protein